MEPQVNMKKLILLALVLLPCISFAADSVPHSAKAIKASGAGFVEVVGPGKLLIDDKMFPYEGGLYIAIRNIDSLYTRGNSGCFLRYSSEGYAEGILLDEQTCHSALAEIKQSRK